LGDRQVDFELKINLGYVGRLTLPQKILGGNESGEHVDFFLIIP
jgi:hypothetical protein